MLLLFDLYNEIMLVLTTMVCTTAHSSLTIFQAATSLINALIEGALNIALVSFQSTNPLVSTHIEQMLAQALLDLGIDLVIFLFGQ